MSAVSFILVCVFMGLLVSSFQTVEAAARNVVTIHGSDTMLILNKELAAVYNRRNTPLKFNIVGGGSELGIKALLEGKTDIAATSRAMKESEKAAFEQRTGKRPMEIVIALDVIGVYVHNNNPVTRLTLSQLKGILAGEIRNWRDVGGLDRRINFYNRDRNSDTRVFIRDHMLAGKPFSTLAREVSSTSMVAACVARNQGAIRLWRYCLLPRSAHHPFREHSRHSRSLAKSR